MADPSFYASGTGQGSAPPGTDPAVPELVIILPVFYLDGLSSGDLTDAEYLAILSAVATQMNVDPSLVQFVGPRADGIVAITPVGGPPVTLNLFTGALSGPVCFYPGTLIATPEGLRAVETLAIGDLVLTAEGQAMPVRWMGRQTIATRFADKRRTLPVRITQGALGGGLPVRDLLVSPRHALFLDGVLVEAGALIGLAGIAQETRVPRSFVYHHVELWDHALVLAEGVPAETFVDNVSREAFDNWAEHEALYGHLPQIEEMDTPRAQSARQLPRALRERLASFGANQPPRRAA